MAYDEYTADRITKYLEEKKASFIAKKMMGGLCFMVDEKMACVILYDKKKETDLLMARIGQDEYVDLLTRDHVLPMDFTGRPLRGFVFVTPDGYDSEEDLEFWLEKVLAFNPFAKASKKNKIKPTQFCSDD